MLYIANNKPKANTSAITRQYRPCFVNNLNTVIALSTWIFDKARVANAKSNKANEIKVPTTTTCAPKGFFLDNKQLVYDPIK